MKTEILDIRKMIEKDLDEAFFELGLMYKKYPNYKTMHNFGALLSKYGHEISFFSNKNIEYAKKLLLSALKQNQSFITLKELGDLYLGKKQYKTAISYYTTALNQSITYSLCYNLSLCYYFLNDYANMNRLLKRAITSFHFLNYEEIALQELLGIASAKFGDKQNAIFLLKELLNTPEYERNPDTIKLAFLCGEHSFILQNYKNILSNWILEAVDYKILCKVFIEFNPERFGEFEKWIKYKVLDFYEDNPNFDKDIELLKAIETKDCIPNIKFSFTPIFTCDFY